jgi:hypothetical protein
MNSERLTLKPASIVFCVIFCVNTLSYSISRGNMVGWRNAGGDAMAGKIPASVER